MESITKKIQKKFKDVKFEMLRWEKLQCRLVSQLSNAFAIIQRLELVQDIRNFGALRCVEGIQDAVLDKEIESFQNIQISIDRTMDEFLEIMSSMEKIVRDGHHLIRGGSTRITEKQLKQRIGVKPTLEECLYGLKRLEEMHQSEYRLKQSIVSSLPVLVLKPSERKSAPDLQRLLVDQPNIPQDEGINIRMRSVMSSYWEITQSFFFYQMQSDPYTIWCLQSSSLMKILLGCLRPYKPFF